MKWLGCLSLTGLLGKAKLPESTVLDQGTQFGNGPTFAGMSLDPDWTIKMRYGAGFTKWPRGTFGHEGT